MQILILLVKSKDLDKSVLDMNMHYLELKGFLEHLEDNPELLLIPNSIPIRAQTVRYIQEN